DGIRDRTVTGVQTCALPIYDGRYWEVTAEYAKAAPEDLCVRVTVRNAGPEAATLDVLPTLWFRNTWSWAQGAPRPELRAEDGARSEERRVGEECRSGGARRP